MSTASAIEHTGIIESIGNNGIKVKFTSLSACASCHAKGYCSASDKEEKEVCIPRYDGEYRVGEMVDVMMERSAGFKALYLAYLYPFFIVMILLLLFKSIGFNELHTGLIALSSLIPYYSAVYLFRNRIDNKFHFSIRKKSP